MSEDGSKLVITYKKPSSSDSSSEKTYAVSTEKSKNGTVKLSDAKAVKGDTVTITVKPEDGYVLDTLTVIDADGDEVKHKDKGDGKFTFTMPASKITVEATFVPASDAQPTQPTQPTSHPFADIAAGSWIDTAVQYVYANGLMTGMSETEFAPSAATNRAMIWTILARRSGADTTGGANWYEKGQQWAIENGISDGSNPSGSITREQLAVMLWRTVGCPLGAGDLSAFTDASSISDYAVTAMQWAIETGLLTGNGSGTLSPKAGATRAETAAMLMRFCEANQ
ncbi:S-layer homology domain-containing protein [Butyricicoccus pullicaecorum]|nr:S-layer homology domain-containing protein [Butyricicoccus pullicaecorum]